MKLRAGTYLLVLTAMALAIAGVAFADAPTDVWTEGSPAETDDDTFEWIEGLPYIIYEEAGGAPTPTPTPPPTPYAEPPTTLTVTPLGWSDDCDFWSGTAALEWPPGLNANGTIIRLGYCHCPETPEDGQLVYDGNGTTTTFDLVISSLGTVCVSAWGYNNLGNSTTYTCICIGGDGMILLSQSMLLGVMLMFILVLVIASYKINSLPLRITTFLACFALMPELCGHGFIFPIVAFLLGLAIVFVTMLDTVQKGPRV